MKNTGYIITANTHRIFGELAKIKPNGGYSLLGFLYPFTFIPQLIASKNKAYSLPTKV